MKTLVIQLDRTEDMGSIRDKVTWGKSSRVLLVWPVNYDVFDRKFDLVIIKRICASQGSRLGIVCDNPIVCTEADELQIPVFDSVNRAMRKGWDRRKRRRFFSTLPDDSGEELSIEELRSNPFNQTGKRALPLFLRIVLLLVGVTAVIAICLIIMPYAEIRIYPVSQIQEMNVDFLIDNQPGGTSNPGILHGSVVNTTVEDEVSRQTTGTSGIPDQKAKGTVSFTNQTDKEIQVQAQTIVLNNANPPVRYAILQAASIPAKGTVTGVTIEALYGGESGNTPSNTITRMDGELGLQMELTNPEPVLGGSNKKIPAPSAEDIIVLRSELQTKQEKAAEKQFSAIIKPDEVLLAASIKNGKVISEKTTPEVGQAGTNVRLTQKVEFSALVISHQNLVDQAEALLAANRLLPGWQISNREPVEVQIVGQEFDRVANTVTMKTRIRGQMIPVVNTDAIRQSITGANRGRAQLAILGQVLTDKPAEIETWPSWLPFLPWIESRINVVTP